MSKNPDRGQRRSSKQKIDYSKEQEFSDEDVFEDAHESSPTPTVTTSRRGRPGRKSNNASASSEPIFVEENRYRYTERGYDPALPHLRERFTFIPEFEADGSPKVELIVGRRPILDDKNRNNNTNADTPIDTPASPDVEEESSSDSSSEPHVRKRGRPRKKEKKIKKKKTEKSEDPQERRIDYEYRIKFKGKSYLHLEWKAASELESMNKSAKTLLRRFLKKLTQGQEDDLEDPDFDNSYAQPQKIVDEDDHEVFVELTDKELVEYERERDRQRLAEEEAMLEIPELLQWNRFA